MYLYDVSLLSGLEMELFINQEQYPAFVQEAGVRLQVHPRHTLPKVEDYGQGIPPGKIGFIGVKKVGLALSPWTPSQ